MTVSSQLGQLLDRAAATEHTTTTVVWVIEVQLVLLALFTLYFASTRTAAERESDVQLAELRGYRPRSLLAVAMAEPMAVIVVAVPLGLAAAWVVASLSASHFFLPGIGASMTTPAVVSGLATAAVAGVSMVFGARRLVSAAESGQGVEARTVGERSSIGRVIIDAAISAVALIAFIELVVVGRSPTAGSSVNPLAAFAPGLLALGVGVLGARLLPAALRPTFPLTETRATSPPPWPPAGWPVDRSSAPRSPWSSWRWLLPSSGSADGRWRPGTARSATSSMSGPRPC